ncbi:hypothetical protein V6O07_01205 [Arthrospira platensis SPKY2]
MKRNNRKMSKKLTEKINNWRKLKLPTELDIEKIPIELLKSLIQECNNFLILSKNTLKIENNVNQLNNIKSIENNIEGKNNIDAYAVDNYSIGNIQSNINEGIRPLDIMDNNSGYPNISKGLNNQTEYLGAYTPNIIKDQGDIISREEVKVSDFRQETKKENRIEEDLELENLIKEVIKKEK